MVALFTLALCGCETVKKIGEVIKNPDIQVGKLADQSSQVTITLLTEPDANINADGEAAAVDVQLVYLSDDSKFQAADYDQIATTALPNALGKNYIDHQDFSLLPDTMKTLPAPLNRWVGKLADQAWHVVMVEAVHYMEVDWRDNVVKPFNEQLADNYPFNPRSQSDASLDAFERFFKPNGVLDTFYQQNLRLFMENDLSLEDGDNNVIIREDVREQLDTAQEIREAFFSRQNGLGAQFAVETVSLSGNKRRSVLNLDGQLVDYSQGRNYTAHLVWPNNMREGNESKLTLIGVSGGAPRSISFSGPWAQFRLFGAGQLTGVQEGTFSVRFNVDGGAMVYRVHTDTEDNPFTGGLFSQFRLPDTLY
ncbi:type VI secretion system lipoprotein TssJ [Salmonella enterica subsp. enterica serovar Enteritidis]|nr:type VI secretion system lipoprotein TssJ [Salmonella enterica subsp. enterica serovar Enteritidis]